MVWSAYQFNEESQLSPVVQLCSHLHPTGCTSCGRSTTNTPLISSGSSDYTRKHQPMPCLGHSMAAYEMPTNRRRAGVKLKNRCLCYGTMVTTCAQHVHSTGTTCSQPIDDMFRTWAHVHVMVSCSLKGPLPARAGSICD